ncbi:N-alpha-acetyltransferase 35, NatC auxiliary subunit [[Candida] jaroonii]|uniref:N-alpha-acetyltransferase 35, NatC auxiliary subunit n=1 Tax=[Candida] jaroonii TaxID=467808 RepID=A0ACA9Y8L8_9ASCO|nr:N-alpha-acetyltransferase 35, NatC auxiliary subunit [[Candida] jaroonii]
MEGFIDITSEIFDSVNQIANNKVVQSPLFDLLEGARAIEVSNKKLDTGLIELTEEELNFNCYGKVNIKQCIGILNKLLRSLMSWLDHSSIPVTLLSCRYVQEVVEQYLKTSKMTEFGDDGFSRILSSAVNGVVKFIGIMITVGNTVLYEEEDITTRALDMNFLNEILIDEVIENLERSIKITNDLVSADDSHKLILTHQLKLILSIVQSPILFNLQIELFQGNPYEFFNIILENAIDTVKYLNKINFEEFEKEVPVGCFSKYCQKKLNNHNIPGELYMISQESTMKNLEDIFQQLKSILIKSTSLKNIACLENWLDYDVQLQINKYHVITRGFLQLYLIRDDQSILGSPTFKLSHLSLELMNNCTLANTVYSSRNWNININDCKKLDEDYNKILNDLDIIAYQLIIIKCNNRCRQRQLINKNLILLDSLQVNCENFEISNYNQFKINDKLSDTEELSLPLTSFVYFKKLQLMIDFLLLGIELELYNLVEIYSIYWYSNYLLKHLLNHFSTRIITFNNNKLVRLNNKRKKLKNASQKIQIDMKRQQLIDVIKHNQQQLAHYQLLYRLTDNVTKILRNHHIEGRANFSEVPKDFLINFEKMFRLRFKPFESIGVPKSLTFDEYLISLKEPVSLDAVIKDLESIKQDYKFEGVENQNQLEWMRSLVKSSLMYLLHLNSDQELRSLTEGYNPYFPNFK